MAPASTSEEDQRLTLDAIRGWRPENGTRGKAPFRHRRPRRQHENIPEKSSSRRRAIDSPRRVNPRFRSLTHSDRAFNPMNGSP